MKEYMTEHEAWGYLADAFMAKDPDDDLTLCGICHAIESLSCDFNEISHKIANEMQDKIYEYYPIIWGYFEEWHGYICPVNRKNMELRAHICDLFYYMTEED